MKWDYSNVKVGDTVWYGDVNSRGKGLTKTTVSKVGAKLITTQISPNAKPKSFRKDSGRSNDAYGHQWIVLDLELYEAEKRADAACKKLAEAIKWGRRQAGVTEADIKEAAKILKINID